MDYGAGLDKTDDDPAPHIAPKRKAPKQRPSRLAKRAMARAVQQLRPTQCKWPLGDLHTIRFCQGRRETGKPYCAQHLARSMRKT